jgi:hypothetical protein
MFQLWKILAEHYQVAENKLRLPISSHGLSHIDSLTVRIVQHAYAFCAFQFIASSLAMN